LRASVLGVPVMGRLLHAPQHDAGSGTGERIFSYLYL
jgi:hypothetical protein